MNPFVLALMNLFTWGLDKRQQDQQNALAQARENQVVSNVAGSQQGVKNAAENFPAIQFGGTTYRPPTDDLFGPTPPGMEAAYAPYLPGGQPINLDDLFHSGQDSLDFFKSNKPNSEVTPLNLDFSGLQSKLEGIAKGATLAPGSLAKQISFPDTDLSSVLAADIAGIGSASKARQEGQQASLVSAAPMFGGLEGVERENASLGFQEGANRAGLAADAVASNRTQEADLEKFKADLQAKLGLGEAGINAELASSLMGNTLGAGQLNLQTEQIKKAIEEGNINRALDLFRQQLGLVGVAGQEDTQRGMVALDTLLKQGGAQQTAASQVLSSDLGLGNILQPGMQQDILSLLSAMGGWMQPRGSQPDQKGQYGVSVLGTGANWSA